MLRSHPRSRTSPVVALLARFERLVSIGALNGFRLHIVLLAIVPLAVLACPARIGVLLPGFLRLILPVRGHLPVIGGGVVPARVSLPRHFHKARIHYLPLWADIPTEWSGAWKTPNKGPINPWSVSVSWKAENVFSAGD